MAGGYVNPMRASDADRDAVVQHLHTAFLEGRLDKEEFDSRVGNALSAKTYGQLDLLLSDLPPRRMLPAMPPRPAVAPRHTEPMAVASLLFGFAEFFTLGLSAIPAIVLGHMARGRIRRTGAEGVGMANVGLILGWGAVLLGVLFLAVGMAAASHTVIVHGPPPPATQFP